MIVLNTGWRSHCPHGQSHCAKEMGNQTWHKDSYVYIYIYMCVCVWDTAARLLGIP